MIDDKSGTPAPNRDSAVPRALPPLSDFRVSGAADRKLLLTRYWARLLNGAHAQNRELLFIPLEANDIILGNGTFSLILITTENFSPNECAVKNLDELYPHIEAKVSEALSDYSINYVSEFGGVVAAVTCFPRALSPEGVSDSEFVQPLYADVFTALVQELKDTENLSLRVCISELFSDANRLPGMFRYMCDVMAYDDMFLREPGRGSVVALSGAEPGYGVDHAEIEGLADMLCEHVRQGDETGLIECVSAAAEYLVRERPHSLAHLFMRIQLLAYTVWQRLAYQDGAQSGQAKDMISMLQSSRSYAELKTGMETVFTGILEQYHERGRYPSGQLREVLDYIGKNINQPWLSAQAVSEKLGISPSLLSIRFKNEYGQRLVDYIQKQRVEYAASLLRSGEASTGEVSRLSGYGSPVTMNRAFKKHFGVSPSDYKKMR